MPIAQGTRLGPYVVQESIGQGAMGVVYRAYHEQLERPGAVKVLQALSPDEETTARFRREAQAIAQMRHPNVLNVFDFGEYEGTPYMIVEYVAGGSLAGRIKQGPLDPKDALNYLRGIGSALDYAHSLGIVHRDVKPANVLVGRNNAPILADFGLAKLLQSSSIKSITGVTTGTPAYMAPEQVTGSQVGPAADRYSLAVMAFEMLSGSLPFDDAGVLEVLYAHVHREPPKPSSRNEQLTGRVDAIILRGLAKDPAARWENCEAFVTALEQVLQPGAAPAIERTVAFAPPMPVAASGAVLPAAAVAIAAAPGVQATTAVASPPVKQQRSRRGLLWVVGAILLLLVLSSGILIALINRSPTLDISPPTVEAGGSVTVTATHVPKGQIGDIQLHSVLHTFAFRADGSGNVSRTFIVPADTPSGDHLVEICWNGSCHAHKTLRVENGVAFNSPAPTPLTSPTPRRSSSPSPLPPSPTQTSNPCPAPPAPAVLSASPTTAVGGTSVTLRGTSFTPKTTITLKYYKGTAVSPQQTWTTSATCAGGFATKFTTATGIARTDRVDACDSTGRCAPTVKLTILL